MANLTTVITLGWEILDHPPYSPDLAPSDNHLFVPMKKHLGGQKFKTDYELKCGVLNWLRSQPIFFYAAAISALP
jgi:hypothetical protein